MTSTSARAVARIAAGLTIAATVVLAPAAWAPVAWAEGTVKIGVIYPLSGNAASAGQSSKAGVELIAEIVNAAHPELTGLPLAATAGLPNLHGAKVEPIFADHQGNPSVGASETVRLITEEKVVAMMGVYQSSVAMSATAEAERQGIPFVVGDSVAMPITQRGFQWTFRVTPNVKDLAVMYSAFLKDLEKLRKVATVALVNENTDYGTSVAKFVGDAIKEGGFNVVAQVPYTANTTDVQAQVLQLKSLNPDVVIFVSYTNDAILYMKTLRSLDYRPPIVIGDDSGFSDPSFAATVGNIAQGAFNRGAFKIGAPDSVPARLNAMFKAKTGNDIDDTTARSMEAFLVLCDAINRAGSTEPAAIQKALRETSHGPSQVILGYKGVKFDPTGQNVLAYSYVTQLKGEKYYAVWPQSLAESPLAAGFKGW
ncbi:MAG: ABC transporter substrate-binding protein [SAR324 cluster bacterium]